MSICKICASNGKPGVTIMWDENIKSQKTGRLIPLESNRSFHRHYEPTNTEPSNNKPKPNPITANAKTISPSQQEDAALEALALEFKTLLKHVSEYLKEQENDG
jgi:hypothetical protein